MTEIPPLPATAIFMVEVGSTAHGTGLPGGEDHDQLAVYVEYPTDVFGIGDGAKTVMHRTQPEGTPSGPGDIDRTVYPLRRFIRLAAAGNPSVLQALWCPVEFKTQLGTELRTIREWFIGRHVIARYRGYMRAQGLRLLGLKGNSGHGPMRADLIAEHGYDTKYAMHAARLGLQCVELLTTRHLTLPMTVGAAWLRAVRQGQVSFDEWWAKCLELDDQMARLLDDESIPEGPDLRRIISWSEHAHRTIWEGLITSGSSHGVPS